MIERWGETIGYTTGTPRGAIFWFVLPESSPLNGTDMTPVQQKGTDGRSENIDR